jgi:hypothetical protein
MDAKVTAAAPAALLMKINSAETGVLVLFH